MNGEDFVEGGLVGSEAEASGVAADWDDEVGEGEGALFDFEDGAAGIWARTIMGEGVDVDDEGLA